jgi:hypothetical protein
LKKLEGKNMLTGDNLSSHLTQIFNLGWENVIYFVCLPPNSTNLMQQLNAAFFHQLEQKWIQRLYWRNKTWCASKSTPPYCMTV